MRNTHWLTPTSPVLTGILVGDSAKLHPWTLDEGTRVPSVEDAPPSNDGGAARAKPLQLRVVQSFPQEAPRSEPVAAPSPQPARPERRGVKLLRGMFPRLVWLFENDTHGPMDW